MGKKYQVSTITDISFWVEKRRMEKVNRRILSISNSLKTWRRLTKFDVVIKVLIPLFVAIAFD